MLKHSNRPSVIARVQNIRNLKIYEPRISKGRVVRGNVVNIRGSFTYSESSNSDFASDTYRDFPVIINGDGSIWKEASLYMLSHIKRVTPPPSSTLKSIAGCLKDYLVWLEDTETCFLSAEMRRHSRPTYKYTSYLRLLIQSGVIQSSTAKKKLSSVLNFYRWMGKHHIVDCSKLWIDIERNIPVKVTGGRKSITSTDLMKSLSRTKQIQNHSNFIMDCGKLRPLTRSQVISLRQALSDSPNTVMQLAFDIALLTGARLETVFTLRLKDFSEELTNTQYSKKILIGGNSLVKAKNDKEHYLYFPSGIYNRLRDYSISESAMKRRKISNHRYSSPGDQYLFLTKSGKAYYIDEDDVNISQYGDLPKGNSVSQFIRCQLDPLLRKNGGAFKLKFHDLRATFGLELLDFETARRKRSVSDPQNPQHQLPILNYVRERMGHQSIETTLGYFSYRDRIDVLDAINDDFEQHLFGFTPVL